MNLMELMKRRFSVRKFDPNKKVSKEMTAQILEAALIAPTAHNNQPFHLYVAGQELSEEIMPHCTSSNFHAALNILITVDNQQSWVRSADNWIAAEVDSAIVGTHMMIMAENLGLGTCWICAFSPEEVKKHFKVKSEEKPISIISIGYKAENCKPSPLHEKRNNLEQMVTFLD